jgi:hypothetical protein
LRSAVSLQVAGATRVQVNAPSSGPGRFEVSGMFGLGLSLGFEPFTASLAGQLDLKFSVGIPNKKVTFMTACAANPVKCGIKMMKHVFQSWVKKMPGYLWLMTFKSSKGIVDIVRQTRIKGLFTNELRPQCNMMLAKCEVMVKDFRGRKKPVLKWGQFCNLEEKEKDAVKKEVKKQFEVKKAGCVLKVSEFGPAWRAPVCVENKPVCVDKETACGDNYIMACELGYGIGQVVPGTLWERKKLVGGGRAGLMVSLNIADDMKDINHELLSMSGWVHHRYLHKVASLLQTTKLKKHYTESEDNWKELLQVAWYNIYLNEDLPVDKKPAWYKKLLSSDTKPDCSKDFEKVEAKGKLKAKAKLTLEVSSPSCSSSSSRPWCSSALLYCYCDEPLCSLLLSFHCSP